MLLRVGVDEGEVAADEIEDEKKDVIGFCRKGSMPLIFQEKIRINENSSSNGFNDVPLSLLSRLRKVGACSLENRSRLSGGGRMSLSIDEEWLSTT